MLKKRSLLELDGQSKLKLFVEPKEKEDGSGQQHFQHSKSPSGLATSFENALISIKLLKVDCRYDVFHDRVHVTNLDDVATSESFEGFDQIVLLLREQVLLRWGFDPGKQFVEDALRLECLKHTFDPVREYLDGLKWDGRHASTDGWLDTATPTTPHSIVPTVASGLSRA
jgi:hypothetical protein